MDKTTVGGSGRVQRERHTSTGNGAFLVVIDSGGPYWERMIVDETDLAALAHLGMSFRLLDRLRKLESAGKFGYPLRKTPIEYVNPKEHRADGDWCAVQ